MSEQLHNCKLTVNSIVSIATLYSAVRTSHMTDEIRKSISTKQEEVKGVISTTDKQLVVMDNKLEELDQSSEDEDTIAPDDDKAETLRQLKQGREAINASRKLLEDLLSQAQEEVIAKAASKDPNSSTTVTFGNQNSGLQAGVINGGVQGTTFGGK